MKKIFIIVCLAIIILADISSANIRPNTTNLLKNSLIQSTSIQIPCYNAQNMPLTLVQAELVSDERVGININYDNNTYGTVVKSFVATLFTIDADNRPFGFAAWEVNPQGGNSIFLEIDDRIFLDGSHRYAMVIDYVEVSTKAPVEKKHGVTSQQATSSQITGLVIDRNLIPNLINGEPIIARYVYIKNRSFCEVAGDNAIATCRGYGGIKSFYCNERTRFVRLKCVD